MYISLFTVAIPVNYTSEFREIYEAVTYFAMLYKYNIAKYVAFSEISDKLETEKIRNNLRTQT